MYKTSHSFTVLKNPTPLVSPRLPTVTTATEVQIIPMNCFLARVVARSQPSYLTRTSRATEPSGTDTWRQTRGHHRARNFAESQYLDSRIKKLVEHFPQLTFNSKMVTAYNSHDASIPPHSDNENSIATGSKITTLSLGKDRPVVFRRKPPPTKKKS